MTDLSRQLAAVTEAQEAHDRAGRMLSAAMRKVLPEGSYVEVPRGNGVIRGTVVGHGCWWSTPTEIRVRVESTGNVINCHIGHLIPRKETA